MRSFGNKWIATAAALLTVVAAASAVAQQADPAARPDDRAADPRATIGVAGGPAGQMALTDKMVANQLFEMSKGEIELANFALKRTQNEEVRRFAQQMIEDHTNFNNQLAKFASPELSKDAAGRPLKPGTTAPQPGSLPAATTPPNRAAPLAGAPARPGETAAASPQLDQPGAAAEHATDIAGGDPSVRICEDISKQIGSSLEKELAQYQGSDFDRAYVGQQFWGHVIFVGAAKGAEKHVSQDLQQVLTQGATTAEKHLEHCRKLIRDMSANVARGTNETTPRR
jgi:predicted outer membrane protein